MSAEQERFERSLALVRDSVRECFEAHMDAASVGVVVSVSPMVVFLIGALWGVFGQKQWVESTPADTSRDGQ